MSSLGEQQPEKDELCSVPDGAVIGYFKTMSGGINELAQGRLKSSGSRPHADRAYGLSDTRVCDFFHLKECLA